jgi:hypothetical protein
MTLIQLDTGTSATPQYTFQVASVPTDLDSGVPVVTLTRPDGTAGPASGTVSHVGSAGSGTYSFVVAAQADPIWFDITWVGTIGGQPQTRRSRVEWVGESLFTLADARAVDGGAITTAIASNQQILDKRASLADRLEQKCGVSFFPRFARETHDGDGSGLLVLDHHRATDLLSVTINGAAQPVGGYVLHPTGELEAVANYVASGSFAAGRGNVTVEYVHGWEQVPGPVRDAALKIARVQLVPSNIGDRATSIATDQGTIFLATAGRGTFQPFGIPEADSALRDFDESGAVA